MVARTPDAHRHRERLDCGFPDCGDGRARLDVDGVVDHARVVVVAAVDERGPDRVEEPLGRGLVELVLVVLACACYILTCQRADKWEERWAAQLYSPWRIVRGDSRLDPHEVPSGRKRGIWLRSTRGSLEGATRGNLVLISTSFCEAVLRTHSVRPARLGLQWR